MFLENLKIAIRAIGANKMRSILTTLGVIIGVASVIAVVSLVQGMQQGIANELQGVGTTYISVVPDAGQERRTMETRIPDLTNDDGLAVLRQSPEIVAYTPIFFATAEATNRELHHEMMLLGVSETYQEVVNHWVEHGRFFTPLDLEARKRVCTLGLEAAKKLGLGREPLGKTIQIGHASYTVVGVMEKRGNMFGFDRDDLAIIPFTTAETVYGVYATRKLRLDFQARDARTVDLAKEQIVNILRSRHHIGKKDRDDFRVVVQEEILKSVSKVLLTTTGVMGGVVGIALLVGGIGIMNIMLVSVTERTREIGIRKAIGARRRDILLQFLIEAIALSGVGGLLGIAGGFLAAVVVRLILRRWIDFPAAYTPVWAVLLAFGFCTFLGVLFGIYPAAKASKLDPIEALRYE